MCSGASTTLPAFSLPGHETTAGNWSRFKPGALDLAVEAAGELLGHLFPQGE